MSKTSCNICRKSPRVFCLCFYPAKQTKYNNYDHFSPPTPQNIYICIFPAGEHSSRIIPKRSAKEKRGGVNESRHHQLLSASFSHNHDIYPKQNSPTELSRGCHNFLAYTTYIGKTMMRCSSAPFSYTKIRDYEG